MAPSNKLPDWTHRLDALVQERLTAPFAWGRHDCGIWAADVVQALTGVDALQEARATRGTAWAARRLLQRRGGVDGGMARAGLSSIPLVHACRGDLVLIEQGRWPVLAVCIGEDALAPGEQGLEVVTMDRAVGAWRV